MAREYVNSSRPSPLIYEINDLVFARRSVRSDRNKGRVGKIMIKHTGPWTIIEKLHGSSYKIHHCKSQCFDKNTQLTCHHAQKISSLSLPLPVPIPHTAKSTRKSKQILSSKWAYIHMTYQPSGLPWTKPTQPITPISSRYSRQRSIPLNLFHHSPI